MPPPHLEVWPPFILLLCFLGLCSEGSGILPFGQCFHFLGCEAVLCPTRQRSQVIDTGGHTCAHKYKAAVLCPEIP